MRAFSTPSRASSLSEDSSDLFLTDSFISASKRDTAAASEDNLLFSWAKAFFNSSSFRVCPATFSSVSESDRTFNARAAWALSSTDWAWTCCFFISDIIWDCFFVTISKASRSLTFRSSAPFAFFTSARATPSWTITCSAVVSSCFRSDSRRVFSDAAAAAFDRLDKIFSDIACSKVTVIRSLSFNFASNCAQSFSCALKSSRAFCTACRAFSLSPTRTATLRDCSFISSPSWDRASLSAVVSAVSWDTRIFNSSTFDTKTFRRSSSLNTSFPLISKASLALSRATLVFSRSATFFAISCSSPSNRALSFEVADACLFAWFTKTTNLSFSSEVPRPITITSLSIWRRDDSVAVTFDFALSTLTPAASWFTKASVNMVSSPAISDCSLVLEAAHILCRRPFCSCSSCMNSGKSLSFAIICWLLTSFALKFSRAFAAIGRYLSNSLW